MKISLHELHTIMNPNQASLEDARLEKYRDILKLRYNDLKVFDIAAYLFIKNYFDNDDEAFLAWVHENASLLRKEV